ncbi:MAG: nicotinate-nucleotide adenylyltransferase [Chloroflexota bacterium]
MKRIGVLGGTFDPPHIGHLLLAEYTAEVLALDTVLFVPAGVQPLKDDIRTPVDHRVEMVKRAIDGNPHFQLSRVDIDREGPHFTADTLTLLSEEYPDSMLYFLMGGDNLRNFPDWKRHKEIITQARLAVMRRSDEDVQPDMHADILPNLAERVDMVDTPLLSIWLSSTHVVERIQQGLSVRYLVPDTVLAYITENALYR